MPLNKPALTELVGALSSGLSIVSASTRGGYVLNLAGKGRSLVGEITGSPNSSYQRAFQLLKDSQDTSWQNSELFRGINPDTLNYAAVAIYFSKVAMRVLAATFTFRADFEASHGQREYKPKP